MKTIDTFFPEYFSQSDRTGVLLAGLCSIAALATLFSITPRLKGRVKEPIAILKEYKHKVSHKISGTVSFYDVRSFEELAANDEIFTGENSTAKIQFLKSKNEVIIPSGSLVKIEEGVNGETVEIKEGVAEFVIKKDSKLDIVLNGKKVNLTSTDENSKVKAYLSNGELVLNATKGNTKIQYKGKDIELDRKETVSLKNNISPIEPTTFKFISPAVGQKIELAYGIPIQWKDSKKVKLYISNRPDDLFDLQPTTFTVSPAIWRAPLDKEGDYYLGVENDAKERSTIPIQISIGLSIDNFLPKDGDSINIVPYGPIKLSWSKANTPHYRIKIKDSKGKENTFTSKTNSLEISKLKGNYFEWYVAPEISPGKFLPFKDRNQVYIKYSGEKTFLTPSNKNIFDIKEKSIRFSWKLNPEESVKFTVEEQGNHNLKSEKITPESSLLYLMQKEGTYIAELSSIDFSSLKTSRFQFDIISPIAKWKKEKVLLFESFEKEVSVPIPFDSKLTMPSDFKIQLSYLVEKTPEVLTYKIKTFPASIVLKKYGKYCAKILPAEGLKYFYPSENYCFQFKEIPPFPPMPQLKDMVMNIIKKDSTEVYKISIPPQNRATKYKIEIYANQKDVKPIYTDEGRTSDFFWESNRSGIYYIKFKVFDDKGRESNFSPFSKLIFPISPLSDW